MARLRGIWIILRALLTSAISWKIEGSAICWLFDEKEIDLGLALRSGASIEAHTHELLLDPEWTHPYTKADAFFPMPETRVDKYWPPVGRIDNVQGDRQLACSCVPIEAYSGD
ncbi:MAG: hypothetical protein VCB07_05695 [Gammaproteobacteria bacterium]